MKTLAILPFVFLCFAVAVSCAAADPAIGYTPMKVIQTDAVIFPHRALELGITSGEARVAIRVDQNGALADYLVVGYTHPSFADSAVTALKRWHYQPAMLDGEGRSTTTELAFSYQVDGVAVVNMDISSYVASRNYSLAPNAYSYHAHRLSELDRIPTPVKVVSPAYPIDASRKPQPASVAVEFYIDENGHVRLPAAARSSTSGHEAFAVEAIKAVSQWQFEPPTSHGKPVLVAARQVFDFNPSAGANGGAQHPGE